MESNGTMLMMIGLMIARFFFSLIQFVAAEVLFVFSAKTYYYFGLKCQGFSFCLFLFLVLFSQALLQSLPSLLLLIWWMIHLFIMLFCCFQFRSTYHHIVVVAFLHKFESSQFPCSFFVDQNGLWRNVTMDHFECMM